MITHRNTAAAATQEASERPDPLFIVSENVVVDEELGNALIQSDKTNDNELATWNPSTGATACGMVVGLCCCEGACVPALCCAAVCHVCARQRHCGGQLAHQAGVTAMAATAYMGNCLRQHKIVSTLRNHVTTLWNSLQRWSAEHDVGRRVGQGCIGAIRWGTRVVKIVTTVVREEWSGENDRRGTDEQAARTA